jgi:phosphotransferase system enzyme I (PtsI)
MMLKGKGVSGGITSGRAYIFRQPEVKERKGTGDKKVEEERLLRGIELCERELEKLERKLGEKKEAGILSAQKLMLKDPSLLDRAMEFIDEGYTAEYAIKAAADESAAMLESVEDPYIKERASDIRDVAQRVIRALQGRVFEAEKGLIVIGTELNGSDILSLEPAGIATEKGSATSHMSIIANALGIPAVVGVKGLDSIKDGMSVAIDGDEGLVILEPKEEEIREEIKKRVEEKKEMEKLRELPATTRGGRRVKVMGNIGSVEDARKAIECGAEGVGLFRTEFFLLDRRREPSEDEQFSVYKEIAELFGEKPVIIRTFDIGGDKEVGYLGIKKESNPFLGVRGVRFCLKRRELFKTQLRAILRASTYGNLKIMYPMVALEDEVKEANVILEDAKNELRAESKEFRDVAVGMMVETPASALYAERFDVDFFSIGSNDLIQYTMAADRTNEELDYLYRADRIMKLIAHVIEVARDKDIEVGVCGEIAGDPGLIPELVRMGIDELSMSSSKIANAKRIVRAMD